MIESGMALLVACLLPIYGLGRVKFANFRESRQRSDYSGGSRLPWKTVSSHGKERIGSVPSDIQMVNYSTNPTTRSHATRTDRNDSSDLDQGQIRIVSEVHVSDMHRQSFV